MPTKEEIEYSKQQCILFKTWLDQNEALLILGNGGKKFTAEELYAIWVG